MKKPVILLTRPEGAARRFMTEAAHLGLDFVVAPLMGIVSVPHDSARLHAAKRLVLTSVHAVPAAGNGAGRFAYCVGPATAAAARQAGFEVYEGPGDAVRLAPVIAGQTDLLHPHGLHVTAGLPVEGMVVYDQPDQELPPSGRDALQQEQTILWPLFSPRSARLGAQAWKKWGGAARIIPLAISEAAAQAWGSWPDRITIATQPDAEGLIAAIRSRL